MKKVVLSICALKAMNFLLETVIAPRHTIVLVQNAMEGMHVLRNKATVDVVIVDLDYDTQENIEFISHIKSSRLYSGCKVIVLSSMIATMSESEVRMVDLIFYKPFSPERVIDFISSLSIQNTTLAI
ncbi:response regulator [Flavitalea sp.]|nr:hypothetical protein [Flavitalea sp.]